MIRNVVIAIAAPIRIDLTPRESATWFNGESLLYSMVPKKHVLSIRELSSVPSIRYSLQCVPIASASEADGASAVTGEWAAGGILKF
jgi:hypothetical protein